MANELSRKTIFEAGFFFGAAMVVIFILGFIIGADYSFPQPLKDCLEQTDG